MTHYHAVVWIDHRVAHIYGFGQTGTSQEFIKSHGPHHIHHKAGSIGSGHERDSPAYFREIAAHLGGVAAILIVGPAETKAEFKTFLETQVPAVATKVVGVEALDQESEGEIISVARKFFVGNDRMTPQR